MRGVVSEIKPARHRQSFIARIGQLLAPGRQQAVDLAGRAGLLDRQLADAGEIRRARLDADRDIAESIRS